MAGKPGQASGAVPPGPEPWPDLGRAVAVLRAGGMVLHPAEAVWGLACDPFNADAVAAVIRLKQRPDSKGLIVVADRFQALAPLLAPVPESCRQAALATWPGPHTWVWPAAAEVPAWLVGERGSLAVRVSAHPPLAALAAAFGGPLVSTSANTSGAPPPYSLDQVDPAIRAGVEHALAGVTAGGQRPTTIRDVLSGQLLRG